MKKASAHTPISRSELMSRVRAKNTKPELAIRKALHARGFRYRLHVHNLPGKPDIVFTRQKAAIFVHGCFWHGHPGCGRMPKTRIDFWKPKIDRNRERDSETILVLRRAGWRVLVIWECCLVGTRKWEMDTLMSRIADWLQSTSDYEELEGIRARK